jgi:hypothetical protein
LGTSCLAEEDEGKPGEFRYLVGVWAPSKATCDKYERGAVDRLGDRASKTRYDLLGICSDGMELLYEAMGVGTWLTVLLMYLGYVLTPDVQ